jgi:hypothetical protein
VIIRRRTVRIEISQVTQTVSIDGSCIQSVPPPEDRGPVTAVTLASPTDSLAAPRSEPATLSPAILSSRKAL